MTHYEGLSKVLSQIESPTGLIEGIFAHSSLGMQIYNSEGRSIYVNDSFMRMFGVAPPSDYSVLNDEIAEKTGVLDLLRKPFKGEAVTLPVTWYDPRELTQVNITEGKRIAMESRAFPVFKKDGSVGHVVFIFRDVTAEHLESIAREKVVKELNDANTLIRELLNGTKAVIYFKDLNSAFLLVNRQFEVVFNLKSEQLLGKSGHEIFPKEVADEFRRNDLAVIEQGIAQEVEESVIHADGSHHVYLSLKFPLKDSEGKTYGLCGISTDVTEHRRTEQELSAARRMESLGVLAGGIAHDFNNILGVILMQSEHLPGAEAIRASAERASELTRKLLAFGRQQALARKFLDLNESVRSLEDMLARLVGADIRLAVSLAPDLKEIEADPTQIEQILINLLLNSRDAMPGGGGITLATRNVVLGTALDGRRMGAPAGNYVELSVVDTGQGMSASVRERMFEPFFSTKEMAKGTGLGLSSVYGIVQQFGGDISVESTEGEGTALRIFFPVHSAGVGSQASSSVRTLSSAKQGADPERKGGTLLIIDDQSDLREITATVLRESGYRVFEAANASEAEKVLRENGGTVDLVISDVIMPEMNGPKLVNHLREQGLIASARILFVSGYSDNKLEGMGITHGEGGLQFLEKPYLASTLIRKIQSILGKTP